MKSILIKTTIPGPKSKAIEARRDQCVAKALGGSLLPCHIAKGSGAIVTDVDGNRFIDLTGGWGCLAVGHSHPKVTKAVKAQAGKYLHTDFTAVPYESYIEVCEGLAKVSPGKTPKSAALFNSGAEAVENAVKISRGYTGRSGIVVFENAFHGRTLLAMTMTHKAMPYKYKFGPFASDIFRLPFPTPYRPTIKVEEIERVLSNMINPEYLAAIVVEPIQGEGGFNVPSEGFFEELRRICDKYGIMLVVDEVQSGVGRTGKFFAIENWNIEPDLICVGKSIAAGLPLSAVVGKKKIMDALPEGAIGGTYVGNPLACVASAELFKIFNEEHLLEKSLAIGKKLRARFEKFKEKYPIVGDVRGIGAMQAIEFVTDRQTKDYASAETKQIVHDCLENGVIVASAGINKNVIRMLVTLEITDAQLSEALDVMENAIAKACKK
ncbi:MAG: aspartate aminotransferase family protein [Candidatus Thermoplasmatota archaeon]|nr:aspartate aminotransferase family protein [Candidatus Thermoplasmatota archaeon]